MNFMEQYLLNRANNVAGSLSSGSSVSGGFPEFVSDTSAAAIPNSVHSIPFITTGWARQTSANLSWDSSYTGQLTTPDFKMPNENGGKMVFWNALGDKTPQYNGDASYRHSKSAATDNNHPQYQTMLMFGRYNVAGRTMYQTQYNGTSGSYGPGICNVMFIKNTTASDITKTVKSFGSNEYGSYNGAAIATLTPNNTEMKSTTGQSFVQGTQSTSNSYALELSCSVNFAANKTTALLWTNPCSYWTTFSSGAHWHGRSYLRNLSDIFDGTGLVPDHKLTAVAYQGRNSTWTTNDPWRVWKECGDIYNI